MRPSIQLAAAAVAIMAAAPASAAVVLVDSVGREGDVVRTHHAVEFARSGGVPTGSAAPAADGQDPVDGSVSNAGSLAPAPTGSTAGPDGLTQGPAGVSAIPEPAVWATMILGLGGVGANQRYRRRSARTSVG